MYEENNKHFVDNSKETTLAKLKFRFAEIVDKINGIIKSGVQHTS